MENTKATVFVKKVSRVSILLVFCLTILSSFALPRLQTQYSLKQFLPTENPLLQKDEAERKLFQLPDAQPFILTASLKNEKATWYDRKKIASLRSLTLILPQEAGVKSTLSLATAPGAIQSEEGLTVGPLLTHLDFSQWQDQVQKNPLLMPTLVSKDGKTASLIINVAPMTTRELSILKNRVEILAQENLSFADIKVAGAPAVQSDVGLLLQQEIRNFVLLGFFACFVLLALMFANAAPLLISFLVVISANIMVLAAMALAGYPFSILSSTIPILVTVDVVSLCIHTLLRFTEEQKKHPAFSHAQLVLHTFKILLAPNFIASTTTMIGFLALLSVKVPLIRDYGLTAAGAIVLGWVVTTALIFPLIYFFPPPRVRSWAWRKARWPLVLLKHSRAWTLAIIIVFSALAIKGTHLAWTARLFDDLPDRHPARIATEQVDQELGGLIPVDIQIKGPADAWNDPKALEKLDSLLVQLRELPGVGSAVGLSDLAVAANLQNSRLPASRASAAETFFLYSLSEDSPLKHFLTADTAVTRLSLRVNDLPGNQIMALTEKVTSLTQQYFPQMTVINGGMGPTIHQLNNQLSHELIFGFWQSMAAICLVLIFVFRSVRWALIACLPNLVPPAALLGFLAISETPIKPSVAIIFSIALGMAFNNTVYLLERLRSLQKNSKTKDLDIEKTMWREANPCLISSITLLAGFSVFMASYFNMNRIFGFYMLLSMIAGLIGDLILLPTLLKVCPWLLSPWNWKKEKNMATMTILLLSLTVFFPTRGFAAETITIRQISQEMERRLSSKDEQFLISMKIIEADGSNKERLMKVWRRSENKKDHALLVRMQRPLDLKGTALLATVKDDQENKWIYLPSNKQTRRLTGESGQGGILGSELSVEDFDFNREQGAENKLKKEYLENGKKFYFIESNVNATSATYSKILSTVSGENFLPIKAECYDKKGHLLKIIDITNYRQITKEKWRAGNIKIKNIQNNRSTEITLSQIKLNQNLRGSLFTPKALSED